ncbi:MAG: hypothetical protein MMC33_007977 [Icmadophila ericetorum]|nr:hypothetical protein [Icmadophila ericetorum]
MAALDYSLISRDAHNILAKRANNWAGHNPGIILVFCIVFIVAVGLISLFIYRKLLARKARQGN